MGSTRKKADPRRRPLTVLFEDDHWVAIHKPAGIPVHGGAGKTGPSVLERLRDRGELHLVHRLDRATAGVLLLARTGADAARLAKRWTEVEKEYWALCAHAPQVGTIERPLKDPDGRARVAVSHVERCWGLSQGFSGTAHLAKIRIETGRLHQIRRHLAAVNAPILNDDKYGDFEANRRFVDDAKSLGLPRPKHLMLFCRRLRLPAGAGFPALIDAEWPRGWVELLTAGGQLVDDLDAVT